MIFLLVELLAKLNKEKMMMPESHLNF